MSSSYTLLIADDEPSILVMLRTFFARQGHTVLQATNGLEVLQIARKKVPDCILMDIQMPIKTGIEAIQELRADPALARVPAIAITAHVREFTPVAVSRAGFDQVIYKPFDFAELQAIVVSLLQPNNTDAA